MSANQISVRALSIFLVALCVQFQGSSLAAGVELAPHQIYTQVAPSVWRVQTYDDDGLPLSIGTAIVIAPDTLVTNCHVLAKAGRVAIRQGKRNIDATLEMWDSERDICQVKAPGLGAPAVNLGGMERLQVGQNVYAIGNPNGLDLTISAGLLSSIRRNESKQVMLLQTSAPISAGSSGGGLFDDQGMLIGLTTLRSVGDSQNLNFAVPVDWIKELPRRHSELNKRLPQVVTSGTVITTPIAPPPATVAGTRQKNLGPHGCVGAANWPVPTMPDDEALVDAARLPYASERMRQEYRVFLTCPLPRAFAISDHGRWWYAWGTTPADKSAPRDPIARALHNCEKTSGAPCFLYAVDNRIVYNADSL